MNASAASPAVARPRAAARSESAPAHRSHGWTTERQRIFLGAVAGGSTVEAACAAAGMSVAAAYALRQTRAGHAFALAWEAANLLARQPLHDRLMAHALEDDTETVVRIDAQTVTRRRFNYRIAFRMLDRIEKRASALTADVNDDARLVAGEFDLFLRMLANGSGPEISAAFLDSRRSGPAGDGATAGAQDEDAHRETVPTPPNVILHAAAQEERDSPGESGETRPALPIVPLYLAAESGRTADEPAACEAGLEEPLPRLRNRTARRAAAARLRHSSAPHPELGIPLSAASQAAQGNYARQQ